MEFRMWKFDGQLDLEGLNPSGRPEAR